METLEMKFHFFLETFFVKNTLGLEKHNQIVGVFSLEVYTSFFKNLKKMQ